MVRHSSVTSQAIRTLFQILQHQQGHPSSAPDGLVKTPFEKSFLTPFTFSRFPPPPVLPVGSSNSLCLEQPVKAQSSSRIFTRASFPCRPSLFRSGPPVSPLLRNICNSSPLAANIYSHPPARKLLNTGYLVTETGVGGTRQNLSRIQAGPKRSRTRAMACSSVAIAPSNWASSTVCSISLNAGPG